MLLGRRFLGFLAVEFGVNSRDFGVVILGFCGGDFGVNSRDFGSGL